MQATAVNPHPAETHQDVMVGGLPIPALDFDITSEIEQLHRAEGWQTGVSVKRLVRFPDLRITLTVMKADARIELHHNPGRISVQTVDGHLRMHAGDQTFDLSKDRMLVLDRGVSHDVEALVDSDTPSK